MILDQGSGALEFRCGVPWSLRGDESPPRTIVVHAQRVLKSFRGAGCWGQL